MWWLACQRGPDTGDAPALRPDDTARVPSPTVAPTGATGGPTTTGGTGGARPPNVLILLSDDQGIDQVAAYGEHPDPPPTPHIDQLAAEGVLFRNAWASPSCSPSRGMVVTGRMPRRFDIGTAIHIDDPVELDPTSPSLPRLLEDAPDPWATAWVGKWHLSSYTSRTGLDHPRAVGWGTFDGSISNLNETQLEDTERPGYTRWDRVRDGVIATERGYATTVEVDRALELMATLPEPWLLVVAFHAPHAPFEPPPPALTPTAPAVEGDPDPVRYRAMVEALDQEIGRLVATMAPRTRERTLLVFASDNGTPEDAVRPPFPATRAKLTPYEGGVNVPLIVSGPLVASPGRTSDALVALYDLLPTVAEVAGVLPGASPDGLAWTDGMSLWPLVVDPTATLERPVLHTERFAPNRPEVDYAVDSRISRGERFKVIDAVGMEPYVFDLEGRSYEDPEPLDLSTLGPDEAAAVDALLEAHGQAFEALIPEG